jgi:hypothetical protein
MRGIPPVLRDAQDADEREWESAMDVLSADLAWLASEYPNHQTIFAKWRGIFKPETFHQSCMFLGESLRRRKIHWICRFLNLTVGQQREMFFLKRDGLRGEFAGINERKKPVMRALVEAYQRREDQYKIGGKVAIKRQFSIWLCGSVASWKPQRTADFFGALMGHKITRQNANRIIKKVWQDVPETNPKNKIKKSTF